MNLVSLTPEQIAPLATYWDVEGNHLLALMQETGATFKDLETAILAREQADDRFNAPLTLTTALTLAVNAGGSGGNDDTLDYAAYSASFVHEDSKKEEDALEVLMKLLGDTVSPEALALPAPSEPSVGDKVTSAPNPPVDTPYTLDDKKARIATIAFGEEAAALSRRTRVIDELLTAVADATGITDANEAANLLEIVVNSSYETYLRAFAALQDDEDNFLETIRGQTRKGATFAPDLHEEEGEKDEREEEGLLSLEQVRDGELRGPNWDLGDNPNEF
jgi:hypothetical protein